MPNTKVSDIRLKVIDSMLRRQMGVSTREMMEAVNHSLENAFLEGTQGDSQVKSATTIRSDLRYIESTYGLDIECISKGREKRYRYKDPKSSIYKVDLSDDELRCLLLCRNILSSTASLSVLDGINSILERFNLYTGVSAEDSDVVRFDINEDYRGLNHFSQLYKACTHKEVLDLQYKTFTNYPDNAALPRTVHPYLMKEYNNRWFLIGRREGRKDLSVFAFDRIERIEKNATVKFEECDIDLEDYFSDMLGVSRDPEQQPEDVVLSFSKQRLPYVVTKPIYAYQTKPQIDPATGEGLIRLRGIRINRELETNLLSFGADVKVLHPEWLAQRIKDKLSAALSRY